MGRPAACECGTCPRCHHRIYMRAWYAGRPGYAAASQRRARARANGYERDRYHNDPDFRRRKLARIRLNGAIRRGEITRGSCEVCGAADAQAHHEDYSRPLDVVWLCDLHHRATHGEHTAVERVEREAA